MQRDCYEAEKRSESIEIERLAGQFEESVGCPLGTLAPL